MSAICLLMAHFYDFCANDEFVSLFLCSKWDIDTPVRDKILFIKSWWSHKYFVLL